MSEVTTIQVGQIVPDFDMETFEPTKGDFGKFSLADARKAGKWTVLVFYPADFTFVCATEFAALAQQHSQLKQLGVDVDDPGQRNRIWLALRCRRLLQR